MPLSSHTIRQVGQRYSPAFKTILHAEGKQHYNIRQYCSKAVNVMSRIDVPSVNKLGACPAVIYGDASQTAAAIIVIQVRSSNNNL